jgi:hypothetical protein
MYTSIEIKGFRCFKHLTIPKLARINLIGGKNSTGKTALLEAIWVLSRGCGSAVHAFRRLFAVRGIHQASVIAALGPRSLLADSEAAASVCGVLATGGSAVATMKVTVPEESGLEVWGNGLHLTTIEFGARGLEGKRQSPDVPHELPCQFVASRQPAPASHVAELYSRALLAGRAETATRAAKHIDDRLGALHIATVGGQAIVHADLGGPRLRPINLVGEGMERACSLMLALAEVGGGVLLVDEMENGLHYSVLPDVWRAIAQAAKDLDVQVFATTHSRECVEAAHEATADMPKDTFLFHRLDRIEGEISSVTYEPDMLRAAFDTYLEVR